MAARRAGRYRLTIWTPGGSRQLVRRLTQREMALVEDVFHALNLPGMFGNDLKRLTELPGGAERIVVREDMAGGAS